MSLFLSILFDERGGTLAITRKTANTLITATGFNTNYSEIEAVVNGDIDATNIENAAVTAAKLASDAVETAKIKDANVTNAKLAGSIDLTAKVTGILPVANGGTEFESGDIILSTIAKAISGWTEVSATYANKFIRISATALSTATGSISGNTDSHTLLTTELPAHTHTISQGSNLGTPGLGFLPSVDSTNTQNTGSSGTGGGHTHGLTVADPIPAYVTLRMWQKN